MEGKHNNNPKLWELTGNFIQVGDNENDFVNVKMSAATGGKGYFFKKDGKEGTVPAMKNSILPVVAAPDSGCNFSGWVKLAGTGDFKENNLASTCYIPVAASKIKPTFTGGGGGYEDRRAHV